MKHLKTYEEMDAGLFFNIKIKNTLDDVFNEIYNFINNYFDYFDDFGYSKYNDDKKNIKYRGEYFWFECWHLNTDINEIKEILKNKYPIVDLYHDSEFSDNSYNAVIKLTDDAWNWIAENNPIYLSKLQDIMPEHIKIKYQDLIESSDLGLL